MDSTATSGPHICTELTDGVHVVSVAGELDLSAASAFREALTQATSPGARLVVDLSAAPFVDSVGVGAILRARRRLGVGGRLAIVIPPRSYAGLIFDVVGADELVPVLPTRAAALEHVR